MSTKKSVGAENECPKQEAVPRRHRRCCISTVEVRLEILAADYYFGKAMFKGLHAGFIKDWVSDVLASDSPTDAEKRVVELHGQMVEKCNSYFQRKKEWGAIKKKVTPLVISNHGGVCFYCKTKECECIDHKTPLIRGGNNDLSNLVPACKNCNFRKRSLTDKEFLEPQKGCINA